MIRMNVTLPTTTKRSDTLRQAVERGLDRLATETVQALHDETREWHHTVPWTVERGPFRRTMSTDDAVFIYQDQGTRPHVIRPRTRRVLRFAAGGDVVYARQVNHPGTRARHMVENVARQMERRIAPVMKETL